MDATAFLDAQRLTDAVREHVISLGKDLLIDHYLSHTGDDIAIRDAWYVPGVADVVDHIQARR